MQSGQRAERRRIKEISQVTRVATKEMTSGVTTVRGVGLAIRITMQVMNPRTQR